MYFKDTPTPRIILASLGLITIILGLLIFKFPPGAFPDPSWGFLVMNSMHHGGGFNKLISPDPLNIAYNKADFLSWWSPGQYLVPYFFKSLLKVNTGQAIALTITACNILGITGFYTLFKKLGFSPMLAAVSVAFIASQQFFILPYIFYTGGEVLLFAFTGWFLYGCFSFDKINWQSLVFIFIAGILGFVCKSSFLWMFAAGIVCMWVNISKNASSILRWLTNGVLLALPFIGSIIIIYVFYLSKGQNPSNDAGQLLIKPETFGFPMASPILAGFSIDELFKGLMYHTESPILSYPLVVVMLVLMTAGSLVYIYIVYKLPLNKNYSLLLTVLYVIASIFFSYLYLKQAAISYEGRHYRIIGLIAIPGFVYLFNKTKTSRAIFAVIWAAFFCWEAGFFYSDYKVDIKSARGNTGVAQQQYDKTTVDTLMALDRDHHGDAVFVVMSPDIAIEFVNNRVITLDVEDMAKEDLNDTKFAGKADILYMLMPQKYIADGLAPVICDFFTGYSKFSVRQINKSYYLYTASEQTH